ncbi:hypothetical protein COF68_04510 [Bacillus toyonensis]|uniref:hypothetical protein n=1 Tax=Bacillus toyonensis TaxID=155322 RepID=UPI000BFDB877|nr:hypothetical protein [Bacillus toyonensis]PHE64117.1 hypothetical protein COF68_04510 [Bacillus toyonensis]
MKYTLEDSYLGFENEFTNVALRGKALKLLDKEVEFEGGQIKLKLLILQLLQEGYEPQVIENHTYISKNGMKTKPKTVYRMVNVYGNFLEFNKTTLNYAQYLVDNKLLSEINRDTVLDSERFKMQLAGYQGELEEDRAKQLHKETELTLDKRKKYRYTQGLSKYSTKMDRMIKSEVYKQLRWFVDEGYLREEDAKDVDAIHERLKHLVIVLLDDRDPLQFEISYAKDLYDKDKLSVETINPLFYLKYKVLALVLGINYEDSEEEIANKLEQFRECSFHATKGIEPLSEVIFKEGNYETRQEMLEAVNMLSLNSLDKEEHLFLAYDTKTGISDIFHESEIPEGYAKSEDVSIKLFRIFHQIVEIDRFDPDWDKVLLLLDELVEEDELVDKK